MLDIGIKHELICDPKPLCVLGVLDTPKGNEIKDKMLEWLRPIYEVCVVYHDGTAFEYPALRFMQSLLMRENRPCLYIHTRGAVNRWNTTDATHRMWREQFGTNFGTYFSLVNVDYPAVACPFSGSDKKTWYNGFVANQKAMAEIGTITPHEDRMYFENMFANTAVNVKGVLVDYGTGNPNTARQYLLEHYK